MSFKHLLYSLLFISSALFGATLTFETSNVFNYSLYNKGSCDAYIAEVFSDTTINTSTSICNESNLGVSLEPFIILSAGDHSIDEVLTCDYISTKVVGTRQEYTKYSCLASCRNDDSTCSGDYEIDPNTCLCAPPLPHTCGEAWESVGIPDREQCLLDGGLHDWSCSVSGDVVNYTSVCNGFTDTDGDGIPDSSDPDDDNDGVLDENDIDPLDPYSDSDGDGIPDIEDDTPTGQTEGDVGTSEWCLSLPDFATFRLGWTLSRTNITCTFSNLSVTFDGQTHYPSSVVGSWCDGCAINIGSCNAGYTWSSLQNICVSDSNLDTNLTDLPDDYENPNLDSNTTNDITDPDSAEAFHNALTQYGASTKQKQDEMIAKQSETNELLRSNIDISNNMSSTLDNMLSALNSSSSTTTDNSGVESRLDTLNNNVDSTNTQLGGISSQLSNIDLGLDDMGDDLKKIKEELVDEHDVPEKIDLEGYTGEDTFSDVQLELESSFDSFTYGDIFSLSSMGAVLPTVTVNMSMGSFTIIEPSMFNGVDFDLIRAVFLLLGALGGFITVFRTI